MELLIFVTDKDIEEHFIFVMNPLEGGWNTVVPINVRLSNYFELEFLCLYSNHRYYQLY